MDRQKCVGHRPDGSRCKRWPVQGATVCTSHGGSAPQVRARAAIRQEVMAWGLEGVDADPAVTLMKLVAQASVRAQRYADELERLVEEHGGLPGALVGEATVVDRHGTAHPAGEYVRALAQLEAAERDRLAGYCVKALAAGIDERMTRVAEHTGALLSDMLRRVMADPELGLSAAQQAALPVVIRSALQLQLVPGTG